MLLLKEAIEDYQATHHLSNAALARKWGLNKSTVGRIKNGKRRPGRETLAAVALKTPELLEAFNRDLYGGRVSSEPPQTTQDGSGGVFKKLLRAIYHRLLPPKER